MLAKLLITSLLCCSFASAEQDVVPSSKKNSEAKTDDRPKNILVQVEWIKLKSGVIEQLILKHQDTGTKLRTEVRKLVKKKEAHVIDSTMVTSRSGERGRNASVLQFIFPTEYDPPTYIDPDNPPLSLTQIQAKQIAEDGYYWTTLRDGIKTPTAFEEHPIGTLINIEPQLSHHNRAPFQISLYLEAQKVQLSKLIVHQDHKDQWGHNKVQFPLFTKNIIKTGVTLSDGQYQFISQASALKKDGTTDTKHIVAVFVRAIVRPVNDK